MSGAAMTAVRFAELDNSTDKAVLLVVAELVDDTGVTFRDQAYVARILCVRRETVSRSMKRLEALGWVSREARYHDTTHQRMADSITLNYSKSHVTETHIDPKSHVRFTQKPCDSNAQSHVTETHSKYKPLTKQEITTAGAEPAPLEGMPKTKAEEQRDQLEEFYEAYDSYHDSKLAKSWPRLSEEILVRMTWREFIRRVKQYVKLTDPKFKVGPHKFVAEKRYLDAKLRDTGTLTSSAPPMVQVPEEFLAKQRAKAERNAG